MAERKVFTISDTTPAAPGTALGDVVAGLMSYEWFSIDADLVGATGGTLDVYLQRKVATDVWVDWLHFPQLAAGAAAVRYSAQGGSNTTVTAVGTGSDASAGTPALAANTFIGGHPGEAVRAVYVAGAVTSAGAAVTIRISCWKGDK